MEEVDTYEVWMLIIGVAAFGAAWLPYVLKGKPLSFPVIYVAIGVMIAGSPLDLRIPDPVKQPELVERLTELVVIVALMGVGLKLDRPVGWRRWNATWRLLAITMPVCIAAFALTGWVFLGLSPAAAILLGAVLAPTDPVLAADVQAAPPMEGESSEVRFALTSESGLNDGLAFPFTNLALAVAAASTSGHAWFGEWLRYDVLYKVGVGTLAGIVIGYLLALLLFRVRRVGESSEPGEGIAAIAITFLAYGATEVIHGYGFLAVVVAALMIRHYERGHEYHKTLHEVAENMERLLMAIVLVLFGCTIARGLLAALTWQAAVAGLAFLFLVRPLAGMLGLAGMRTPRRERAAIAFFGIRGIGSLYYLAYALNKEDFAGEAKLLWATVGFVVLASIVVHGISAAPVMKRIERVE